MGTRTQVIRSQLRRHTPGTLVLQGAKAGEPHAAAPPGGLSDSETLSYTGEKGLGSSSERSLASVPSPGGMSLRLLGEPNLLVCFCLPWRPSLTRDNSNSHILRLPDTTGSRMSSKGCAVAGHHRAR